MHIMLKYSTKYYLVSFYLMRIVWEIDMDSFRVDQQVSRIVNFKDRLSGIWNTLEDFDEYSVQVVF